MQAINLPLNKVGNEYWSFYWFTFLHVNNKHDTTILQKTFFN